MPNQRFGASGRLRARQAHAQDLGDVAIEFELYPRERVIEPCLKCGGAVRTYEGVGILARWELHDKRCTARVVQHVDRFDGCVRPGRIGIEAQEDAFCVFAKLRRLLRGERRAERCHGVGEPALVQRDAIEVTFDDDEPVFGRSGPPRDVERVKPTPFRVDRRRGRVEILRFATVERAAAERDGFTRRRVRRDHQPIAVEIVEAALPLPQEPRGLGRLARDAVRIEFAQQRVPRIRCEAELERVDRRHIEPAPRDVRARVLGFGRHT